MRELRISLRIDPETREKQALDLLDSWPWKFGGAVIGGYAVSSYGRPRYSNDLDLVIPFDSSKQIINWLLSSGFEIDMSSMPNPQNYSGRVYRLTNDLVTLDVLSGAVRDREARVDIPEPWITMRPITKQLITITGRTANPIQIARPEAMWALKLQSGRDQDITDLFSISSVRVNKQEVLDLFEEIWSNSLERKLKKTVEKVHTTKIYDDSMSRMGMKKSDKSLRMWDEFQSKLLTMIPVQF